MRGFVGLIFELLGFAALIVMACMALFAVGEHIDAPSLGRGVGLLLLSGCVAGASVIALAIYAFFRIRTLLRRKDT